MNVELSNTAQLCKLLAQAHSIPQNELEVELRINSMSDGHRVYQVPSDQFILWKRKLDAVAPSVEVVKDTIYSKRYKQLDYRCIQSSNQTKQYQQKIKSIQPVEFNIISSIQTTSTRHHTTTSTKVVPLRLAVSQEIPCTQQEYDNIKVNEDVRYRNRSSYFYPKPSKSYPQPVIRIDLTEVEMHQTKMYQVELEFINLKIQLKQDQLDDESWNQFEFALRKGLGALYSTVHTIFSPDKFELYKDVQFRRGLAPVNIQSKHIAHGLKDWYVTNKLDGTSYSLLAHKINSKHLSLFLRNDTDCWLINTVNLQSQPQLESLYELVGTELKVEVIQKAKIQLYLFDILSHNNQPAPKEFRDRIELMHRMCKLVKAAFKHPYEVYTKQFFNETNIGQAIQSTLQHMLETNNNDEDQVKANNDGIIFQSNDTSESPLKWKYQSKISIDFLFAKVHQTNDKTIYSLNTLGEKDRNVYELEPFKDSHNNPIMLAFASSSKIDNYPANSLDKLVIECGYKPQTQKMFAMRIRWDKFKPNSTYTAKSTYHDMLHERTIETLTKELQLALESSTQQPTVFNTNNDSKTVKLIDLDDKTRRILFPDSDQVFNQVITNTGLYSIAKPKHAVQIARSIINVAPLAKTILDATAGVGGNTLQFMKTFATTIAVEKDDVTSEALIKNLNAYKPFYKGKVIPIKASFVELLKKWNQASKQLPNVDVMYMDPPWGGTGCNDQPNTSVYYLDNTLLSDVVLQMLSIAQVVVLRLGKNIKMKEFVSVFQLFDIDVQDLSFCWLVIITPKGFGFRSMRNEHNQLKVQLISQWCKYKRVLDLGSGKGGDLYKYKESHVSSLVLVEPYSLHFDGLRSRLNANPDAFANIDIKLLHERAEAFTLQPKERKFDVVSMFFVLTFFFKSETLLNKLLDVISSNLIDKGMLIGSMMVATNTLKKLLPYNSSNLMIRQTFTNDTVYGNEIEIDLKNTQTASLQTEYLVDFNTLVHKCAQKGLHLYECVYPNTMNLSPDEQVVSKSTLGFTFIKTPVYAHLPMALGDFTSWRIPSHSTGANSFFACVLNACNERDTALHNFIYEAKPYEGIKYSEDDLNEFRASLQSKFTLESYLVSTQCKHDLMLLDNLPHKLKDLVETSSSVYQAAVDLEDDELVDQLSSYASECYITRYNSLACDAIGVDILPVMCDLLEVNIHVMNLHDSKWIKFDLSTQVPTLKVVCINFEHYELVRELG